MKPYVRDREDKNNKMVHSSSVCYHNNALYLAFYCGPHEGWEERVILLKKTDDEWVKVLELPLGSGNPVLITINSNLFIAYSQFKGGTEDIKNVPTLWTLCDTYIAHVVGKSYKNVAFYQNLCPRCNPVYFNNSCIVSLYDETMHTATNIIFKTDEADSNRVQLGRHSFIGRQKEMHIQPSLYINNGGVIAFEARNHSRYSNYSIVGSYQDTISGSYWDVEYDMNRYNFNESVVLFNYHKKIYRIYGNTAGRTDLMLQEENNPNFNPIKLNELNRGCYPNACKLPEDQFMVCFTEYHGMLSWRTQITLKTFDENCDLIKTEQI